MRKAYDRLPQHIQLHYQAFKKRVETSGIQVLRMYKGYHYEALVGDRKAQKSVRLSRGYRVIFREWEKERILEVIDVTKHGY